MHIARHNENEVTAYGIYNDEKDGNFHETLSSMRMAGFVGGFVHQATKIDLTSVPPNFQVFVPPHKGTTFGENVHGMFEYIFAESEETKLQQQEQLLAVASLNKSLVLANASNYGTDPIAVANGVASLIDSTGGLSINHVCLLPEIDDAESVRTLAEELVYLDVPGPTIKSRLIVDLVTSGDKEETLDECLQMGVNKFIVSELDFDWLESIVEENGKRFVKRL